MAPDRIIKFALFFFGIVLFRESSVFASNEMMTVDYRSMVSQGDLDYINPAARSEEGMPVGNGRMGSLVWTTPAALHFQINRCDVFGEDSSTVSFPQADSDYAAGCGFLDINLTSAGDDVFAGKKFHQHLSIYDALMTAEGNGVTARVLAWPQHDVMAVEIDDRRKRPEPIDIDLEMLRYQIQRVTGHNYQLATNHADLFQTAEQTALSTLDIRDGRIFLTQEFHENTFYDTSAVGVSIIGRKSKAIYLNGSTVQLSAAPGRGTFTILISSAASFDPREDAAALAAEELQSAESKRFSGLQNETTAWWHDFWRKGFVYMHSNSGQADFVEANYTYFIYLMGASSRGDYPPRFGGMLWRTTGDMSRWGSQYWWANMSAYYSNLMPANRLDLMEPLFKIYSGMLDACALAAKQQWGSQGIWIPETTFFNGPEKLPDDLAAELQDLMLCRKPYSGRSTNFQFWAETKNRHNSRWNFLADGHWDHGHYIVPTKGGARSPDDGGGTSDGIFGHTTHILADAAKIGDLYWQRFQFTMDTNWLRNRAYPIIKGAAEFYRNFPNFKKESDGRYHIDHVNNNESDWNSSDTPNEIDAMQMIFPLAIHASKILGVDADLRSKWQDIVENLAPEAEMRGDQHSHLADGYNSTNRFRHFRGHDRPYGAFVAGEDNVEPIGPQAEMKRRFLEFNRTGGFIDPTGGGGAQIFRNRLRLREGPGAIDAEHLGGLASGIHETMLSNGTNSLETTISIFNQWPDDWDAAFQLLAHGAFLVSSAHVHGKIPFVEIRSQAGGDCVLKNPWPKETVIVYRNGIGSEHLSGDWLKFSTTKGEDIVVAVAEIKPSEFRIAIP
ncbi:MAG TPA: DUF5703 domain-containing protein [Verrucomicrobiae bacterium]